MFKNSYLYTPWEKDLLKDVKGVKTSLDIVCPFIKLPIIKKILITLNNDIKINFRILTRFTKQVFLQKSSDLAIFDLLLNYASVKHEISIYKLDNLHAKIYIFDNEKMYITSSNLSYSGLNSNFEIAVHINNPEQISIVKEKISNYFIPEYQIFNKDIELLSELINESKKLYIIESQIEEIQTPEEHEEDPYDNVINDDGYKDEVTEDIIDSERQNRTLEEINKYLGQRGVADYNILEEVPFESPQRPKTDIIKKTREELTEEDKKILEEFEKYWLEKATKDEKRIDNYISKLFGNIFSKDKEKLQNLKEIFIHVTWRNLYFKDEDINSKNIFLGKLGRAIFYLLIADSLIKRIIFSEDTLQRYYVKQSYITSNYPYGKVLSDIGCKFCLNTGDLKSDFDRELFEMFLGVLSTSLSLNKFYKFYKRFLDRTEEFIYDNYFEYDSKSYLNEIIIKIGNKLPIYNTLSESGSDHKKEFEVAVSISNKIVAKGKGKSKKEAEQNAAHYAIIKLSKNNKNLLKLNKKTFKPSKKYHLSSERIEELKELNKNLPINLKDIGLLDIALTHPSYSNKYRETRSYRRLSYLGNYIDSYFKLYNIFFKNNGKITKNVLDYEIKFSNMSPKKRYIQIFNILNLKKYFRIYIGSINDSIKNDTMQALIASVFIDKGYKGAKEFNFIIWKDYLEMETNVSTDSVTEVQQIVQRAMKEKCNIDYKILMEEGPNNDRIYEIGCFIEDILYGKGRGTSIKKAKQKAAELVLNNNDFLKEYNSD